MGKIAKQLISAIAISATMGAGAALADSSVVTNTSNVSTVEENTHVNVINTSTSTQEESNSAQSDVTISTQAQVTTDKSTQTESVETTNQTEPTALEEGTKGGLLSTGSESNSPISTSFSQGSNKFSQYSGLGSTFWGEKNIGLWDATSDSQQPVQAPVLSSSGGQNEPTPTDPFGGIINGLGFLSKTTVPAQFIPFAFEPTSIFIYGISALLFSFVVLVLLNARKYVFAQYTDRLKNSGYIHAPRSDALVATYFATPLKWVLSSAFVRA